MSLLLRTTFPPQLRTTCDRFMNVPARQPILITLLLFPVLCTACGGATPSTATPPKQGAATQGSEDHTTIPHVAPQDESQPRTPQSAHGGQHEEVSSPTAQNEQAEGEQTGIAQPESTPVQPAPPIPRTGPITVVMLPRYGTLVHLSREVVQATDAALHASLLAADFEVVDHAQRTILAPQVPFGCEDTCARKILPNVQADAAIRLILWDADLPTEDDPFGKESFEIDPDPEMPCFTPSFSETSLSADDSSLSMDELSLAAEVPRDFYTEPSCLYMVAIVLHDAHHSYSIGSSIMTAHPEKYIPKMIQDLADAYRRNDMPICDSGEDQDTPCKYADP